MANTKTVSVVCKHSWYYKGEGRMAGATYEVDASEAEEWLGFWVQRGRHQVFCFAPALPEEGEGPESGKDADLATEATGAPKDDVDTEGESAIEQDDSDSSKEDDEDKKEEEVPAGADNKDAAAKKKVAKKKAAKKKAAKKTSGT